LLFAGPFFCPQHARLFSDLSCSPFKTPHNPQQQQAAVCAAGLEASAFANSVGQRQTKCGIPATKVMIAVR
jgi:hypothetical protein